MKGIGMFDVRVLALGMRNGGRIDERILGASGLSKSGTGRMLDGLASLSERGLIRVEEDRSFRVTEAARMLLWNPEAPIRERILGILEVGALTAGEIAGHLNEDEERVREGLEGLRRDRLVMMSPRRTEGGLEQVFEQIPGGPGGDPGILGLLGEIEGMLEGPGVDAGTRDGIRRRVSEIRSRLGA